MTGKEANKRINKIIWTVNELSELKNVDPKLITTTIKYLNEYKFIIEKAVKNTEIEVEL